MDTTAHGQDVVLKHACMPSDCIAKPQCILALSAVSSLIEGNPLLHKWVLQHIESAHHHNSRGPNRGPSALVYGQLDITWLNIFQFHGSMTLSARSSSWTMCRRLVIEAEPMVENRRALLVFVGGAVFSPEKGEKIFSHSGWSPATSRTEIFGLGKFLLTSFPFLHFTRVPICIFQSAHSFTVGFRVGSLGVTPYFPMNNCALFLKIGEYSPRSCHSLSV